MSILDFVLKFRSINNHSGSHDAKAMAHVTVTGSPSSTSECSVFPDISISGQETFSENKFLFVDDCGASGA